MSELIEKLKAEFQDKETRHVYVDEFLNAYIATQIKVLREQREWSQDRLAKEADMKQSRISVLEDVNYYSWSITTLKRLAKAFDVPLNVSFGTFGDKLFDIATFGRASLERCQFADDPVFKPINGQEEKGVSAIQELFKNRQHGQQDNIFIFDKCLRRERSAGEEALPKRTKINGVHGLINKQSILRQSAMAK